MALEGIILNPGFGGKAVGVDTIDGESYEVVKQAFGVEGALILVSIANPLPSIDAATQTALAAILAKIIAAPCQHQMQLHRKLEVH